SVIARCSFELYGRPQTLPSFPTLRSSDLVTGLAKALDSVEDCRPRPPAGAVLGPINLHLVAGYQAAPAPRQQQIQKGKAAFHNRSEEHTSELQSREKLVCRLLLEKKNQTG